MLLKADVLEAVAAGRIRCVFRWWRRPTVRAGGTLRTHAGVLAIDSVEPVAPEQITAADARAAGYPSRAAAVAAVTGGQQPAGRRLYRIRLHLAGPDPRTALRAQDRPDQEDLAALRDRLARLDAVRQDPWTRATLTVIARRPGVRAAELAAELGRETARFKTDVRKLKELGLTESLPLGYQLSPRGRALLAHLDTPRST